jgi:hypothetical protein
MERAFILHDRKRNACGNFVQKSPPVGQGEGEEIILEFILGLQDMIMLTEFIWLMIWNH